MLKYDKLATMSKSDREIAFSNFVEVGGFNLADIGNLQDKLIDLDSKERARALRDQLNRISAKLKDMVAQIASIPRSNGVALKKLQIKFDEHIRTLIANHTAIGLPFLGNKLIDQYLTEIDESDQPLLAERATDFMKSRFFPTKDTVEEQNIRLESACERNGVSQHPSKKKNDPSKAVRSDSPVIPPPPIKIPKKTKTPSLPPPPIKSPSKKKSKSRSSKDFPKPKPKHKSPSKRKSPSHSKKRRRTPSKHEYSGGRSRDKRPRRSDKSRSSRHHSPKRTPPKLPSRTRSPKDHPESKAPETKPHSDYQFREQ